MASASGPEDDDPLREARAYNTSILFMLTMPYLLLTTAGVVIYKGLKTTQKKNERENLIRQKGTQE